jgi:hypothetical protein
MQVEGLARVVVGAHFEADDANDRGTRCGHDDDPDVVLIARAAGQRQPVRAGKADIQQRHVPGALREDCPCLAAADGGQHAILSAGEVIDEQLPHGRITVDDQHAAFGVPVHGERLSVRRTAATTAAESGT